MYIGLGMILSIFIFISVIKAVSNRNWTLLSSIYGHEEYYQVIGKLKTEGVKFKAGAMITSHAVPGGFGVAGLEV